MPRVATSIDARWLAAGREGQDASDDDARRGGLEEHDALGADDRTRDSDDRQEGQRRCERHDQPVGEGQVPRDEQGRGDDRGQTIAGEPEDRVRARATHRWLRAPGDGQVGHAVMLRQDELPRQWAGDTQAR